MRRVLAFGLAAAALLAVEREARAGTCVGRPTDPGGYQGYSYGASVVSTFDTALVKVHYTVTGPHTVDPATTRSDMVPDQVAFAAQTGQDALTTYQSMGYRLPPSDASCASNGGDEKLDIYLLNFAAADGTTSPDDCDGRSCSSFVLTAAQMTGRGYATAEEGFKTVITHELFHSVQNVYDSELDRFWAEGTAQWAMKKLHPELQDFERQLPPFFESPDRSLDSAPGGVTSGYLYGAAVWPLFLSLTNDDTIIRSILEREADGTDAISATDAVLQTKGSSLATAFPTFSAWNVATKDLAGSAGYPEASAYPGVATAALADGANGITSGLASFSFRGVLDADYDISVETDATRNAALLMPIEDGKARVDQIAPLPAHGAKGQEIVIVVAGITTKKTDAPFTIHLSAPCDCADAGAPPGSSGGSSSGGCAVEAADAGTTRGGWSFGLIALVAGVVVVLGRRRRP